MDYLRNGEFFYVGMLLNPKSLKPCMVYISIDEVEEDEWSRDISVHIFNPETGSFGKTYDYTDQGHSQVTVLGQGYFNSYSDKVPGQKFECIRVHTPEGVLIKGQGLGFVLYAGLLLAAESIKNLLDKTCHPEVCGDDILMGGYSGSSASPGYWPRRTYLEHEQSELAKNITDHWDAEADSCIYSIKGGRTNSAETWWETQSQRKFTKSYPYEQQFEVKLPKKIWKDNKKAIQRAIERQFQEQRKDLAEDADPCFHCGKTAPEFTAGCKGDDCKALSQLAGFEGNISDITAELRFTGSIPNAMETLQFDDLIKTHLVLDAPYITKKYLNNLGGLKEKNLPAKTTLMKMDLLDVDDVEVTNYLSHLLKRKKLTRAQKEARPNLVRLFANEWPNKYRSYIRSTQTAKSDIIDSFSLFLEGFFEDKLWDFLGYIEALVEEHSLNDIIIKQQGESPDLALSMMMKLSYVTIPQAFKRIVDDRRFGTKYTKYTLSQWYAVALRKAVASFYEKIADSYDMGNIENAEYLLVDLLSQVAPLASERAVESE
jgi:hypothetical protein